MVAMRNGAQSWDVTWRASGWTVSRDMTRLPELRWCTGGGGSCSHRCVEMTWMKGESEKKCAWECLPVIFHPSTKKRTKFDIFELVKYANWLRLKMSIRCFISFLLLFVFSLIFTLLLHDQIVAMRWFGFNSNKWNVKFPSRAQWSLWRLSLTKRANPTAVLHFASHLLLWRVQHPVHWWATCKQQPPFV